MYLFTIGFTQKSAKEFFSLLVTAGVRRVIDTRLNNRSQLAGFSKADDLPYFLRQINSIEYQHCLEMAPTQQMLDRYKKLKGSWNSYEFEFLALMKRRHLAESVNLSNLESACLLCSEHEPTYCHRRLVAEHLRQAYPEIEIIHLR